MKPVDEYHQLLDTLYVWQGYDPAVKTDLSSTAVCVGGGMLFIDPVALAHDALNELAGLAKPAAVILTNENHERAADLFCKSFSIPLFAHENAAISLSAHHLIADGEQLFRKITAIHLPGPSNGELALHLPEHGGVMIVGDALINLEQHGFGFLPDKYCVDAKQAKESLRKLLNFDFQIMTFAHGSPITSEAKGRLNALLQ